MKVIAKEKGFYLAVREIGEVFEYEGEGKITKKSWFQPYDEKKAKTAKAKESGSAEASSSSRASDTEVI